MCVEKWEEKTFQTQTLGTTGFSWCQVWLKAVEHEEIENVKKNTEQEHTHP